MDSPALLLALALAWDASFGEVPARAHPVVWLGAFITGLKKRLHRPEAGPVRQLLAGLLLVALSVALSLGAVTLARAGVAEVAGSWGRRALELYVLQAGFAARALLEAGERMRAALDSGGAAAGRGELMHLCSRSPEGLDASALSGAALESLAENASDSVTAPLFWFALGGLEGLVAYRVINTLDAMVGYRGRYEHFGKAAARLDDLLNLVPARLTAGLLLVAGALQGRDWRRGVRVLRADGRRTASPNAGWPMAAAAGLLGVRLVKAESYVLGEGLPAPEPRDLRRGLSLVRWTMALAGALALATVLLRATAVG
ncbi:MAG: adenosylcobinamide-phosphate synthase CbiB [Myxococcota bacterium]